MKSQTAVSFLKGRCDPSAKSAVLDNVSTQQQHNSTEVQD